MFVMRLVLQRGKLVMWEERGRQSDVREQLRGGVSGARGGLGVRQRCGQFLHKSRRRRGAWMAQSVSL